MTQCLNKLSMAQALRLVEVSPGATYFWQSGPGMGKTQAPQKYFKDRGYTIRVLNCPEFKPEDLAAVPVLSKDRTTVRMAHNEKWAPQKKVLWIFDEAPKNKDIYPVLLPVITEGVREFMGFPLPEDNIVLITGNTGNYRAGDVFPPHILNRCTNIEISDPTVDEAVQVALERNWDSRVVEWLKVTPSALCSYDAAIQNLPATEQSHYMGYFDKKPQQPFCSMRSLEGISGTLRDLARAGEVTDGALLRAALAGRIGPNAAQSLSQFIRQVGEYVDPLDIVQNPQTCRVPKLEFDKRLAALAAAAVMTKDNWQQCLQYATRLGGEITRVFVMNASRKQCATALLINNEWQKTVTKYL